MKISVVIPVYNEEKYISTCLESLKKQTIKPDEVIVVDNNCQDKTITIAENYNVKIVKEKKQGMIYARNRGFNTASCDILARCDADCILPPNWIEKIKANFTSQKIQALTGSFIFYDLFFNTKPFIELYLYIMHFILKGHTLVGSNMIITKKTWDEVKNNVCTNDKKVHEDIDLTIHVLKTGGKIVRDKSLEIKVSARRIKTNPLSFLFEYPLRLVKTLMKHK